MGKVATSYQNGGPPQGKPLAGSVPRAKATPGTTKDPSGSAGSPKDTFLSKKKTGLSTDSLAHVLGYVGPGKSGKDLLNIAKTSHEFRDAHDEYVTPKKGEKQVLLHFQSFNKFFRWQKAHQGKLVTPNGDKSQAYLEMPKKPEAILPERNFSLSIRSAEEVSSLIDWHKNLSDEDRLNLNLRALTFAHNESSRELISFLSSEKSAPLRASVQELSFSSFGFFRGSIWSDEEITVVLNVPWGGLNSLNLSHTNAGPATANVLGGNSELHKTLSESSVQSLVTHFKDSDQDLAEILSGHWINLKFLSLADTEAGLATAKALGSNSTLHRTLSEYSLKSLLHKFKDSDRNLAEILSGHWIDVNSLNLVYSKAGAATAKSLAGNESLRKRLKKLDVSICAHLSDAALAELSSVPWEALESLHLSDTKAGPATAKALADNESLRKSLKQLDLDFSTHLADADLARVLAVPWGALEYLGLAGTKAGAATAKSLAGNGSLRKSLKQLDLDFITRLADADFAVLLRAPWAELSKMSLPGDTLGDKVLAALLEPNNRVEVTGEVSLSLSKLTIAGYTGRIIQWFMGEERYRRQFSESAIRALRERHPGLRVSLPHF